MQVVDIPLNVLREAPWNPNHMDQPMTEKLGTSISRFGLVQNLVVRPVQEGGYEVLSGNQRLRILRGAGIDDIPCVVVNLDDAHARILAQALNRIQGEDDLGLKAELLRKVLEVLPEADVLAILPETSDNLQAITSMGMETIATCLQNWQLAQAARLKHMQFQLTAAQLEVVEEALARLLPRAAQCKGDSPNTKGTALFLLCKAYIEKVDQK